VLDADHAAVDVEVTDGEPERLADPQPGGEQQLEQAAVERAVAVREDGVHLVEAEDAVRSFVVQLRPLAALELTARVDRDRASSRGVREDARQRAQRRVRGRAAQATCFAARR
jgi:hypothetical protein